MHNFNVENVLPPNKKKKKEKISFKSQTLFLTDYKIHLKHLCLATIIAETATIPQKCQISLTVTIKFNSFSTFCQHFSV